MTENKDLQEKETRMKARMFGTFTPPQTGPWNSPLKMPPLDLLRRPFEDARAVAYFYCNNCALFGPIDKAMFDRLLDTVNENAPGPMWDTAKRAQFNAKSQFIVAFGCPKCSPFTAIAVVDIPSRTDTGANERKEG